MPYLSGIQMCLGILCVTPQPPGDCKSMQKPLHRLRASCGVRPYLWREGNQGGCVESWPTPRMAQ